MEYSKLVYQKQLQWAKRYYLFLLIQVCISLSPTCTRNVNLRWRSAMIWILYHLLYTQRLFSYRQLVNYMLLWSGSTKSWSWIDSLISMVDLHWKIFLASTSTTWLTWKCLVQFSELGGGEIAPISPPGYTPGRNIIETETSRQRRRPGRDLTFETETRDLKICELCRYFSNDFPKNVITTSKLIFFQFLAFFLPALVVSYL